MCLTVCGRSRKPIHDEEPKLRGQQEKELRRGEGKAVRQKKRKKRNGSVVKSLVMKHKDQDSDLQKSWKCQLDLVALSYFQPQMAQIPEEVVW